MPPQTQGVTMYKDGRDPITVAPDAVDTAVKKGWSKDQPKAAQPTGQPTSAPAAAPKGDGGMKPGFMSGFKGGINPFHSAPENMPQVPGGIQPTSAVGKAAADTVNLREISARSGTGDLAGAVGMGVGTAASLAGPELLKGAGAGIKALGAAGRAVKEIPFLARSAERATQTARALRVSPEAARFAERMVQPLHVALDSKFEKVHKALEQYAVPMSQKAVQLVRRLQKSEIPAVYKIGEELSKRTALDYREAEGLRRELMGMLKGEAEHWTPQLRQLANELDGEIGKLAKTAGVEKEREVYRATYGQVRDLANAAATTAKQRVGKIRGSVGALAGAMGRENITGVEGMLHSGSQQVMKASSVVEATAKQLARKLGVDVKTLKDAMGLTEKVGATVQGAATTYQGGQAAKRAASGAMSGN